MYKLYKIERIDRVNYDEYDKCVVIAEDKEEALKIADVNYYVFTKENTNITEIKLDRSQPVLGSYIAG